MVCIRVLLTYTTDCDFSVKVRPVKRRMCGIDLETLVLTAEVIKVIVIALQNKESSRECVRHVLTS